MGKKAKTAGTTKHRQRTCDKPEKKIGCDIAGLRSSRSHKRTAKQLMNEHFDSFKFCLNQTDKDWATKFGCRFYAPIDEDA